MRNTIDAVSAPGVARAIERVLDREGIPGCSVALIDRNGVRWADGFGFSDLRSGQTATAATRYHLFSGTKVFTATAVMQLMNEGCIALNDDIGNHVFEAAHLTGVTIERLLSHQSGLRDSMRAFLAVHFPAEPVPTANEALAMYPLRQRGTPGTRVAYANVNYALLGALITRASGLPFEQFIRMHVLARCSSAAEFDSGGDWDANDFATGYIDRWDPMRALLALLHPAVARRIYRDRIGRRIELAEFSLSTAAIGGLVGSVLDFAPFVQSHLADDGRLLPSALLLRMQSVVARGAAGVESRVGVGLGWKHGVVGERSFLNHEGGGPGFTSEMRLYPADGLGVVLAMNAMQMPRTMRVAHQLCEVVRAAAVVMNEEDIRGG